MPALRSRTVTHGRNMAGARALLRATGVAGSDFGKSRDAFADLGDTGTPEGISADAREGFEILVDLADEADSNEDAEKSAKDLSSDEKKKVDAFGKYAGKTCAPA